MQSNQVVGPVNRNISFLIKYGTLVAVLCINYALNNPAEQAILSTISDYEQELSKNKHKIIPVYHLIISIL
ncbi:MAG: hypothetical protein DHS20C17_19860 [Cyclobacteriaceae bacterium]|nr:MAG: hypothetical protein DHS20C17_19860 [Cyclobacteriaceae bacterium]